MDWHSNEIEGLIRRALDEDVGAGDATSLATVSPNAVGRARILARAQLICAGLPIVQRVFHVLDPTMKIEPLVKDGGFVGMNRELMRLQGFARAILTGERTALNFLSHLSGIATLTSRFVEQLKGTKAKIRDTRKTTPGLRTIEKYAVRVGCGTNHRFGLYDAILLKENHIALAGGVRAALDRAHAFASTQVVQSEISAYEAAGSPASARHDTSLPVQIEVKDEQELHEAIKAGAESVLLDNMTPQEARSCVELARRLRSDCVIEISGGITLENARAYAETGADFLSSGALTHSAPAADLSLLVDSIEES
jgi:nicotinate-nucleotide pyrophosphorylase (carboxylating)